MTASIRMEAAPVAGGSWPEIVALVRDTDPMQEAAREREKLKSFAF